MHTYIYIYIYIYTHTYTQPFGSVDEHVPAPIFSARMAGGFCPSNEIFSPARAPTQLLLGVKSSLASFRSKKVGAG